MSILKVSINLTIVQLIPTDNSKKVGEIFLEYAKKSEILDKTLENFNKEFKKNT